MSANETCRPTRVRYRVVLLATLVAVMLYLDRVCLSMAGPYLQDELHLSRRQMSLLLGAFFIAYALGQVPAGWLSDRYGPRQMLAVYLALWSACTAGMGLLTGFVGLLLLRLGCGLTEAGAYPACAGLLSVWVPARQRGLASGLVSIGGRAGGALAQVLTGYLIVAFAAGATAHITAEDLLDIGSFAKPLANASLEKSRQRVLAQLPAAQRELLHQAKAGIPLGEADRQALSCALDRLLERPDLVEGCDLSALDLPYEARGLLLRPEEALSATERARRNRLLLEALFPRGLRKLYEPGWRPTLILYGAVGLGMALLFWWGCRDQPRHHPGCNAAEVALIEADLPPSGPPPQRLPWGVLLRSGSLWLLSAVQFFTNLGWAFLLTWLPDYLQRQHQVPIERRGWLAFVILLAGIPGMYLGGWGSDRLSARWGPWWGRSGFLALSRFLVMAAFLACAGLSSAVTLTIALCLVSWGTDLGTPAIWAYCQDVGGRQVGTVLGWGNMWGNLGAGLSPLLLAWVEDWRGPQALFGTCAMAFLLAGLAALGVRSRPLFPAKNE
jgi:ACS family glucarate transporter-like MFS transporter